MGQQKHSAISLLAILVLFSSLSAITANSTGYSVDMYASGSQGAVAGSANYLLRMLMAPFQPGTRNAASASYSASIGFFRMGPALAITAENIYFRDTMNGSAVNLYISAGGYQSIWAGITLPDGSTVTLPLANNANTSFSQTALLGRYNVTFYANSTTGAMVSQSDYFEASTPVVFNLLVIDENLSGTGAYLEFTHQNSTHSISSATGNFSLSLTSGTIDFLVKSYGNSTWVALRGIAISSNTSEALLISRANPATDYLVVCGISNPFAISDATVRIYYNGTNYTNESALALWKCGPFDYPTSTCTGTWEDMTSFATQNASAHYFELSTASFSGFAVRQGSYCGDGSCSGSEACSSCQADCGACPAQPPSNNEGSNNGGGSIGPAPCTATWECTEWAPEACPESGVRARACIYTGSCGTHSAGPIETQACTPPVPPEVGMPENETIGNGTPAQCTGAACGNPSACPEGDPLCAGANPAPQPAPTATQAAASPKPMGVRTFASALFTKFKGTFSDVSNSLYGVVPPAMQSLLMPACLIGSVIIAIICLIFIISSGKKEGGIGSERAPK